MHLLTAITFVLITFSTAQDLTAGEKCDSSTDCYGSADCLGESYDEKYCCDSDVEYSCDGCRYGDGKCDYCPQYGSSVSIDKLSCTSADSKLDAGAPCTSDSKCSSYECKGDRTKSGSRHCCDSSVGYSCAACDSTGLCNQCDTGTLSADKKSCDIELKDIGDYCDTDSQCKNSCAKSSSSYSSSSSSSRCCAENVLYSCDGCDSNGLCNRCDDSDAAVSSDYTRCEYGGGGANVRSSSQYCMRSSTVVCPFGLDYSETPVIVGALSSAAIVIIAAAVLGSKLSNGKENEPRMCCCARSVAIASTVGALSLCIVIFIICLSQTFLGLLITYTNALYAEQSGQSGGSGGTYQATWQLFVLGTMTLPILLSCLTVAGALLTVLLNRTTGDTCNKNIVPCITMFFGFLMICSLSAAGLLCLVMMGLGGGPGGAGSYITGYMLMTGLLFVTPVPLLYFTGAEVYLCCCCRRPQGGVVVVQGIQMNNIRSFST